MSRTADYMQVVTLPKVGKLHFWMLSDQELNLVVKRAENVVKQAKAEQEKRKKKSTT